MDFRTRLLLKLRAVQPILREQGVLIAGSEVPNLLEPSVQMPDPTPHRALLARLMARLEKVEQER